MILRVINNLYHSDYGVEILAKANNVTLTFQSILGLTSDIVVKLLNKNNDTLFWAEIELSLVVSTFIFRHRSKPCCVQRLNDSGKNKVTLKQSTGKYFRPANCRSRSASSSCFCWNSLDIKTNKNVATTKRYANTWPRFPHFSSS